IVAADVAHVLHIGRLEERVDAGEMRQLAPRKRRDALVGQAVGARQSHVERPLLLLAPRLLGQAPLGLQRLPPLRGQPVEVGMMGARRRGPANAASSARAPCRSRKRHAKTPWDVLLSWAASGLAKRSTGTGVSRVRSKSYVTVAP